MEIESAAPPGDRYRIPMLIRASGGGLGTTGYRCGPLNEREAAVGWLAERVRADLAAEAGR